MDHPSSVKSARTSVATSSKVRVDVTITNTGDMAGEEVVQLWLIRESGEARPCSSTRHWGGGQAEPTAYCGPEDQLAPTLTYHSFCQSTHLLGLSNVAVSVMRRAGLCVADLPEGEVCCGFGGSTSIDHPEVSRWIVDRKLVNARATGVRVLASDNPGCILHLRGAANAPRDQFEVCHFVELLADRLSRWTPRAEPRRS